MRKNNFKKPHQTLFFRRWTRKSYGVFRSQGKQVAISTMVMAASLTFETGKATAQVDTTESATVYELEEVIVSGEQEPVPYKAVAKIVTVMDQKEIEAAPVSDINELLEYALSLDIRQRGQQGVQADIAMRGGTFDQTLVLLNGINISDPQTGHHNLNLPLDLNSIKRIEVLEGPASRAFGVNAFNGAINIITSPAQEKSVTFSGAAGQYGFTNQQATLNMAYDKTAHFISSGHKKSRGYLPDKTLNNTDFNTSHIFYHGQWKNKNQRLDLQAGYNTKAFGANSFYTPAYPEQFEATRTLLSTLRYQLHHKNVNIKPAVYFRRHHDRFELFRDTAPAWYTSHNYHMTDVAGGKIPILFSTPYGNFSINTHLRYAHIYSNNLGKMLKKPVTVPGENANFTKQAERFHTGIQAAYTLKLQKFYFTGGAMVSHYSTLKRTRIYPGLEASIEIFRGFRIFGSYNEALRLPTFTDLYYNGPTNVGNPDLKPEESQSVEGGLKYSHTTMQFQSAVFYRKGSNIIEWTKNAENEDQWQTQNLTTVNTRGVDVAYELFLSRMLNTNIFKKLKISYAYVDLNHSGENVITKYTADNLKHKLSIRLSNKIYKGFYTHWGIQHQDRAGSYTEYKNGSYGQEVPYKPFWLLNLKLGYRHAQWNFFVNASNILDEKYHDIGNIIQPGRWITAGIACKLIKQAARAKRVVPK